MPVIETLTRDERNSLATVQKTLGPSTVEAAHRGSSGETRLSRGFIAFVSCYVAVCLGVFVTTGVVLLPGLQLITIGLSHWR
jgi:hypothetical protein